MKCLRFLFCVCVTLILLSLQTNSFITRHPTKILFLFLTCGCLTAGCFVARPIRMQEKEDGREFKVPLRELILVALCARETLMHSSCRWLLNSFARRWFIQQCTSLKTWLLNVMHPKWICSRRPPSLFSKGAPLRLPFPLGSGAPAVYSPIFLIATQGASYSHHICFSISNRHFLG